jgi:hypothetical protein
MNERRGGEKSIGKDWKRIGRIDQKMRKKRRV